MLVVPANNEQKSTSEGYIESWFSVNRVAEIDCVFNFTH